MTDLFYEHHIFCCVNQRPAGSKRGCCQEKGAERLQKYMKVRAKEHGIKETRINQAACLDRCELGPVMVIYPEGVWYTYASGADIDEILETHLIGGKPVERLRLENGQTALTAEQLAARAGAEADRKAGEEIDETDRFV